MGIVPNDDSQCTEVMAPVAHADRSPVLLFMGGGMGAGKSTVLKDILKEYVPTILTILKISMHYCFYDI